MRRSRDGDNFSQIQDRMDFLFMNIQRADRKLKGNESLKIVVEFLEGLSFRHVVEVTEDYSYDDLHMRTDLWLYLWTRSGEEKRIGMQVKSGREDVEEFVNRYGGDFDNPWEAMAYTAMVVINARQPTRGLEKELLWQLKMVGESNGWDFDLEPVAAKG